MSRAAHIEAHQIEPNMDNTNEHVNLDGEDHEALPYTMNYATEEFWEWEIWSSPGRAHQLGVQCQIVTTENRHAGSTLYELNKLYMQVAYNKNFKKNKL